MLVFISTSIFVYVIKVITYFLFVYNKYRLTQAAHIFKELLLRMSDALATTIIP